MNNNCTSLLLLVALLSYNNSNGCNNCNNCNDCGCNNCGCNNNCSPFNNAGMLCLLLAFLSSSNCSLNPTA
ncbi:MAG: hypothetical protein HFE33_05425 [Clostridia bacterium]|nr:hypothetical protein [Clostridia bacterium]MCI8945090.1 hypothetical protein [Clostridia bacterium]MCI9290773.1 hypothetical protein [Clostridia bacterium]